jgi:hypothetical protein
MSGAYTAKPAIIVTPSYPPGWVNGWAFVGPLPPGYVPAYGITIDAPSSVAAGEHVTVHVKVVDYGMATGSTTTYPTSPPTGDSMTVRVISGSSETSFLYSYGDVGDSYYGKDFDLQINDDTTIWVNSSPFESPLSAFAFVTAEMPIMIEFEFSWSDPVASGDLSIWIEDSEFSVGDGAGVSGAFGESDYITYYFPCTGYALSEVYHPGRLQGGKIVLATFQHSDYILSYLAIRTDAERSQFNVSLSAKIYSGSTVIHSYTKTFSIVSSNAEYYWLSVNAATGDVTELNTPIT